MIKNFFLVLFLKREAEDLFVNVNLLIFLYKLYISFRFFVNHY